MHQGNKENFYPIVRSVHATSTRKKEVEEISGGRYKRFEILKGKCENLFNY
jgi:hypothetical protein